MFSSSVLVRVSKKEAGTEVPSGLQKAHFRVPEIHFYWPSPRIRPASACIFPAKYVVDLNVRHSYVYISYKCTCTSHIRMYFPPNMLFFHTLGDWHPYICIYTYTCTRILSRQPCSFFTLWEVCQCLIPIHINTYTYTHTYFPANHVLFLLFGRYANVWYPYI